MTPGKKSKLTISILSKLRERGAPSKSEARKAASEVDLDEFNGEMPIEEAGESLETSEIVAPGVRRKRRKSGIPNLLG